MKMKKLKFNGMDFVILLVIIAAILTIALRSGLKDSVVAARSNETIVYTLRINNLQKASFDILELNDKLYAENDDKYLGTIVEKSSRPAESYISLSDGEIVKTYIPDRLDIFLTVECNGRVTSEGCMLGGNYFVASGKYITAYTDSLAFSFEVTDAYKKP